jgi:hypothetical protein
VGGEQHKPEMMPGIIAENICCLQTSNVKVAIVGNFILVAVLWRQLTGSLELGV